MELFMFRPTFLLFSVGWLLKMVISSHEDEEYPPPDLIICPEGQTPDDACTGKTSCYPNSCFTWNWTNTCCLSADSDRGWSR